MKIQAHRGASAYAPENTLPAFEKAIQMKSDGVECDIYLTDDDEFVLCHDDFIDRTSNGEGSIGSMTVAQLKKYDYGSWFSKEFKGTEIPTLHEFLDIVKGMDIINIEIKGLGTDQTRRTLALNKLLQIAYEFNCFEKILFSCFNHEWLKHLRQINKNANIALLVGGDFGVKQAENLIERYSPDAIHPYIGGLTQDVVDICKRNNADVNVWTVNTFEQIEKAISLDVSAVITDVPDVAAKYIK